MSSDSFFDVAVFDLNNLFAVKLGASSLTSSVVSFMVGALLPLTLVVLFELLASSDSILAGASFLVVRFVVIGMLSVVGSTSAFFLLPALDFGAGLTTGGGVAGTTSLSLSLE